MFDRGSLPEFGIKRNDEEYRDGGCAVVFDPESQKLAVGKQDNGALRLFSGGVDKDENIRDGILREVTEESGLYDFIYVEKIGEALAHYHNTLRNVNRLAHATCFLVVLKSADLKQTRLEDHERFSLYWASYENILQDWESRNQNKDNDHWIYFLKKSVKRAIELGYDKTSKLDE